MKSKYSLLLWRLDWTKGLTCSWFLRRNWYCTCEMLTQRIFNNNGSDFYLFFICFFFFFSFFSPVTKTGTCIQKTNCSFTFFLCIHCSNHVTPRTGIKHISFAVKKEVGVFICLQYHFKGCVCVSVWDTNKQFWLDAWTALNYCTSIKLSRFFWALQKWSSNNSFRRALCWV